MALRDTIDTIIRENGNRLRTAVYGVSTDLGRQLRNAMLGANGVLAEFAASLLRAFTNPSAYGVPSFGTGIANWFRTNVIERGHTNLSVPNPTTRDARNVTDIGQAFGVMQNQFGQLLWALVASVTGGIGLTGRWMASNWGQQFQQWDAEFRPNLINEAPLLEAWRRKLTDDATVTEVLARYGLTGEAIHLTMQAAKPLLPPDAIRELYLRGWLTEHERNQLLSYHGWTQSEINRIVALYPAMPSPSDLVTFSHREAFEEDQVRDLQLDTGFDAMYQSSRQWWDAAGVTEPLARLYWRVGWQIPAPTMLFEMYHRKAISQDMLNAGLKAHDYQPMWNAPMLELSYTRPSLVDIRRMHAMGTITEEVMIDMLEKRGLSPDDARRVAAFYVVYNRDVSTIGKVKPKELTASAITDSVADGLIPRDDAEARLALLGYKPDDASILVGKVLFDRQRRLLKDRQAAAIARLKSNRITEEQARQELAEYSMPEDEIDAIVDRAIAEAFVKGDPITEAQAKTAYERALLTREEIQSELNFRGYTPRRVGLLFKLWGEYGAKREDQDSGTEQPTQSA